MGLRDIIAQYILPVLAALALYLIRRATMAAESRAKAAGLGSQLDALERVAEASVANVEQTMVRDLKDPTKEGHWDKVAAESAKNAAMDQAKDIGRILLLELNTHGLDSVKLLGAMIERAVLKNRASGASKLSAPSPEAPKPTGEA